MPEYLSGKKRTQKIGISSYSENTDTTKIIGNVLVNSGKIGVGTTSPTQDVDVESIRIRDSIYDYTNSKGEFGYYLVKDTDGVKWVAVPPIESNAIFVAENNNILGVSSFTGINFVSDGFLKLSANISNPNIADIIVSPRWLKSGETGIYTTKNVGIGTTIPTADFQVGFGTTGVTIDGAVGVVSAVGYFGNYANFENLIVGLTTVADYLDVVGVGTTSIAAFLASSGGITTTGGDLYVGGELFIGRIKIENIETTNLVVTGISTLNIANINVGIVTNLSVTGITTLNNLNVTGITSTKNVDVDGNLVVSNKITTDDLNSQTGIITNFISINSQIENLTSIGATIQNLNAPLIVGVNTLTGIGSFYFPDGEIDNAYINQANIETLDANNADITSLLGIYANITTIESENLTSTNIAGTSGTVTNLNSTNANLTNIVGFSGTITNVTSTNLTSTNIVGSSGTVTNLNSTNIIGTSGTITNLNSTNLVSVAASFNTLRVAGISTFTNGPVLIGSGTSTGTSNQLLQVTGGSYISGNVGIGTTNPTQKLDVLGSIKISGQILDRFNDPGTPGAVITSDPDTSSWYWSEPPPLVFDILKVNDDVTYYPTLRISGDGGLNGIGTVGYLQIDNELSSGFSYKINPARLGIGTTSPQFNLDVYGNGRFTGNLLISGITTTTTLFATNVVGTSGTITNLNSTNVVGTSGTITNLSSTNIVGTSGTITNLTSTNANLTNITGTSGTITNLNSTNIVGTSGTITNLNSTNITGTSGTITNLNSTNIVGTSGTINNLNSTNITGTSGTITTLNSTSANLTNIVGTSGTITNLSSVNIIGTSGTITNLNSTNITGTSGTITNLTSTDLVGTSGTITTLNSTSANLTNLVGTSGTITNLNSTNLTSTNLVGTSVTITTLNSTNANLTNIVGTSGTISNLNSTDLVSVAASFNTLRVAGISTFTNGPVLIGSGTSTGTSNQLLQVTGGSYISGNVGIGTTLPQYELDVNGTVKISGQILDRFNSFGLQGSVLTSDPATSSWFWAEPPPLVFSILDVTDDVTYYPTLRLSGTDGLNGIGTASYLQIDNELSSGFSYKINPARLGIGTTSPQFNLDVYGNGRFTGNLLISGITTTTTLNSTDIVGTSGTITTLSSINVNLTNIVGTSGTITNLNSTNLVGTSGTITNLTSTNIIGTSGTITNLNSTNLVGTSGTITTLSSTNANLTNIVGTSGTITNANLTNIVGTSGTITNVTSTNANLTNIVGTSGTITTLSSTNLNSTSANLTNIVGTSVTITNLSSTDLTFTNIVGTSGTITNLVSTNFVGTSGTVTTLNSTNLTSTNLVGTSGTITNVTSTNANLINLVGTSGTITNLNSTNLVSVAASFNTLRVAGISTFSNGPVLIGSGASTGTPNQPLQVTGGSYISGNVGIGTTLPQYKLDVVGNAQVIGILFVGDVISRGTSTEEIVRTSSGILTTVNTNPVTIDAFSINSFRSAKYLVQITTGNSLGFGTTTSVKNLSGGNDYFPGVYDDKVLISSTGVGTGAKASITVSPKFTLTPTSCIGGTFTISGTTAGIDTGQTIYFNEELPILALEQSKLTEIQLNSSGLGYTSIPSITIQSPIIVSNPVSGVGTGVTATASVNSMNVQNFAIAVGIATTAYPTVTFSGPSVGTTATGIVGVGVSTISIVNAGSGYTVSPSISISKVTGFSGSVGLGISTLNWITSGGSGFTTPPTITITGQGGIGIGASIEADVDPSSPNGLINFRITNVGSGYTATPTVDITGDGVGAGVTLTSMIVTDVTVNNSGSGSTSVISNSDIVFNPVGGIGTDAVATVSSIIPTNVVMTNVGSGYTTSNIPVTATFSDPSITADVGLGVETISLVTTGIGYTVLPTITFSSPTLGIGSTATASSTKLGYDLTTLFPGPGIGATASVYYIQPLSNNTFGISQTKNGSLIQLGYSVRSTTLVSVGGTVTQVNVTDAGSGYASNDIITAVNFDTTRPDVNVGVGFSFLVNNTVNNFQVSDLLLLQTADLGNPASYVVENAGIADVIDLGDFSSDISGGNSRLRFTPRFNFNTIKFYRTAFTI